MPSRWSISCWTIRAARSVSRSAYFLPSASRNATLTQLHRSTSPLSPGTERHHSISLDFSSECSRIVGFIIAIVRNDSSSYVFIRDTTISRLFTPTWGAARPTPPLSGFLICFTISSASERYFFISWTHIISDMDLRISLSSHVSIWSFAIMTKKYINMEVVNWKRKFYLNSSDFSIKFKS